MTTAVADARRDHAHAVVAGAIVGTISLAAVFAVIALVTFALALIAAPASKTVAWATLERAINTTGQ